MKKIAEAQSQVKSLQDKITQLERENGELKSKASQVCEIRDLIYEFEVTRMNKVIKEVISLDLKCFSMI